MGGILSNFWGGGSAPSCPPPPPLHAGAHDCGECFKTKFDQNIHKNAPNCTIFHHFLGGACPRTPLPCTACNVATCIYTLLKKLHASVKSCNVCTFIAFWKKNDDKKGPLFSIFKRSPKEPLQLIKNNHAMVVSIVLQKHYFYGICAFSKKTQLISRVLVRSLKSLILRVTNVKRQNLTHPKAAKLATLHIIPA